GVKALISPSGGFGDYDVIEEAIASGKCDAVDMARAYIVEPEFARKAAEGRKEDRIPCIGCNKCHNPPKNKWSTICSVNPMLGLAHSTQSMVRPAVRKKNVAIIGGGPAGMRAAIFCRERGHSVTIYEKSGVLGGQLTHADYPDFKWPLKEYKDYLIRQVTKDDGITVRMNTEATPDMISAEAYDAVIVAIGAEPVIPPVPGADTVKAWTPIGVYGHEQELGKRVVIVGGGDSGTETGIYLADCGHDVTVLTRKFALASDNMGVHFYDTMKEYWERLPNFRGVVNATTTKVEPGKVFYADAEGDHVLECDSIVLCGGVRARDDLVMAFWNCAPEVVAAGDCLKPGALNDVNFSAYSAACRL
ncbi:MAG: FAD-dependent oxidoreductase, partial [Oscillospiraceae bacterium]